MILPLKIALGVIVSLLLGLGGTGWYAKTQASKLEQAQQEMGALRLQARIAEAQAAERDKANQRLAALVKRRIIRDEEVIATSLALQEKINALTDSCTFSANASRVLWEVYERAGRVQTPARGGSANASTDASTTPSD